MFRCAVHEVPHNFVSASSFNVDVWMELFPEIVLCVDRGKVVFFPLWLKAPLIVPHVAPFFSTRLAGGLINAQRGTSYYVRKHFDDRSGGVFSDEDATIMAALEDK